METSASPQINLNDSLSKREVTFCDESSLLYYGIRDTVDSLNNGAIQVVNSENFPLPKETLPHAKYVSDQCLGNLPEVRVSLEKLPEDLVQMYTHSNSVGVRCRPMPRPTVTQNLDQTCSLNSDLSNHDKVNGDNINQTNSALKSYKCPLFGKGNNSTSENVKSFNLDASAFKQKSSSKKRCTALSFDKYPCVHLEKINLGPYLKHISCADGLQGKKDVPVNTTSSTAFCVQTPQKCALLNEVSSKTVNFTSSAVDVEDTANSIDHTLSGNMGPKESLIRNLLTNNLPVKTVNFTSPGVDVEDASNSIDLLLSENMGRKEGLFRNLLINNLPVKAVNFTSPAEDASNSIDHILSENVGRKEGLFRNLFINNLPVKTENCTSPAVNVEDAPNSIDHTLSENMGRKESMLRDLLTNNLSGVPTCISNDYKNNSRGKSLLPNENIEKDTNSFKESRSVKNTQNKIPYVLLERLALPSIEIVVVNSEENFIEPECADSVPTGGSVSNVPNKAIQVKNVHTISKRSFNKMTGHNKNSMYQGFTDAFNESQMSSIIEPKSNNSNSIKYFKNGSKNHTYSDDSPNKVHTPSTSKNPLLQSISTNKVSCNEVDTPLSKQKLINVQSADIIDDSSSEDDTPLLSLPKKLINDQSADIINDSSSEDDTPVLSLPKKKLINVQFIGPNEVSFNEDYIPLMSLSKQKLINDQSAGIDDSSSEDDTPVLSLLKKKLINVQSVDTSDVSSNEDAIPLIPLSKKKLINLKSVSTRKFSSTSDIPTVSFSKTNTSLTTTAKDKNSHVKSYKHKKKNSMHHNSSCSPTSKKISNSNNTDSTKITKNKKYNKCVTHASRKKIKNKISLQKKQLKIYKMIMKFLKIQIKSKKHKSNKRRKSEKNLKKKKLMSVVKKESCSESDDSVVMTYDSAKIKNEYSQNENSVQTEYNGGEFSSTPRKKTKAKTHKKLVDKYRLGFLSNKYSLRFYNKFLASEQLLLSECKIRKNKKKQLKRLFNRLKAVGLASYK